VAVDPPTSVCLELARWGRGAVSAARASGGELRLLEHELLHVTLCFLGERPVGEIEAIGQAVAACAAPVGELSLGAPLWLPPRRPRTLAVELHDDERGALQALRDEVVQALAGVCDFEPERRRFRPHITVARMRAQNAPRDRALPATPALSFVPRALVLYRSWLSRSAASYEALVSNNCSVRRGL
jgi:2'-5' RNA ligase